MIRITFQYADKNEREEVKGIDEKYMNISGRRSAENQNRDHVDKEEQKTGEEPKESAETVEEAKAEAEARIVTEHTVNHRAWL
jgi:hypothetical protein